MKPAPEFLAIVYALDSESKPDRVELLRNLLVDPAFDWVRLQELLLRHRVLALFCAAIQRLNLRELLPSSARSLLDQNVRHSQMRQLSAVGDLLEVAKAFAAVHIEFLCLKGPVLGQMLYGDLVLRHFGDLDLLVRQSDIGRSVAELRAMGFELLDLKDIESRGAKEPVWKHLHHVHLRRGKLSLELHWRLSRNDRLYNVSIDRLFAEKQEVVVGGVPLYALGNVHLVDYLALHGSSHCWNRLKWLCDANRLRGSVENLVSSSADSKSVRLMDSLVDSLWQKKMREGIELPRDPIATLCLEQLLSPREFPGALGNMVRRTRVLVCLYPTLRMKTAYLRALLVWPGAYKLVRLPKHLTFLYYIIGPCLWLKEQLLSEKR